MKVHSDKLTYDDLRTALPVGVEMDARRVGSRSRDHGFDVSLCYFGTKVKGDGRRWRNTGSYGAGRTLAATYDEHGQWMARLFDIDPDAIITYYKGRDDFHRQTRGRFNPMVRILRQSDITRCPHVIFAPQHYRADGTCKCNDPDDPSMVEWGYAWDGSGWGSPEEAA